MASEENFVEFNDVLLTSTTSECDDDDLNVKSKISIQNAAENYQHFTEGFTKYSPDLTHELMEFSAQKLSDTFKPGCCAITSSNLSKQGLQQIDIIKYHSYITHLNISANYITDTVILSQLPFLEYLDASQNLISNLLDFAAPINLKYVNYSFNLIQGIPDLSQFWSLDYLNISHNLITKITGLSNLGFLQHLDLSYNYIYKLEGITSLTVTSVILDDNEIDSFEDTVLPKCRTISISNNRLQSLQLFEAMPALRTLNAINNKVKNLFELSYLQTVFCLVWLDLRGNPIVENPMYEETLLFCAQKLRAMDGKTVDSSLKAEAIYNHNVQNHHMEKERCLGLKILGYLSTPNVDNTIFPCAQENIPVIVMIGPMSFSNRTLAKLYKNYYGKGIVLGTIYTTRKRTPVEPSTQDRAFVTKEQFFDLLENGKFLAAVYQYGIYFGVCREDIHSIKHAQAIIYAAPVLELGLQLQTKYPNCRLILAMPKSEDMHYEMMNQYIKLKPWFSTYSTIYQLIYVSDLSETKKEAKEKQRICSSIVQEIIDYIELIHERRVPAEDTLQEGLFENKDEHIPLHVSTTRESSFQSSSTITSEKTTEYAPSVAGSEINIKHSRHLSWLNANPFCELRLSVCGSSSRTLNDIMEIVSDSLASAISVSKGQISADSLTMGEQTADSEITDDEEIFRQSQSTTGVTEPCHDLLDKNCLRQMFIEESMKQRLRFFDILNSKRKIYVVFNDRTPDAIQIINNVITDCEKWALRKNKETTKQLEDLKYQKMLMARCKNVLKESS